METFVGALATIIAVYVLLRTERTELRGEIRQLRTDVTGEIGQVRGEIRQLRTDVTAEIGQVRGEVAQVRGEVAQVRAEVADLRSETREGFRAVNQRIDVVTDALLRHVIEGHPPHQAA